MDMYIGVMSGTSVDGIDAVLVTINDGKIKVLNSVSQDFPDDLSDDVKNLLKTGETSLKKLGEIDHRLALSYADCVNKLILDSGVERAKIVAIGCHGQTVYHAPGGKYPFTMQIGDGNLLAAKTGITSIVDFRRMDMAFGGEGAPLTPAFHHEHFRSENESRVILNLGGIANITVLGKNEVIGLDTGPANCLIDLWIQNKRGERYDSNGDWARSGQVNEELLSLLLEESYFSLYAPKSTGKELFNMDWLSHKLSNYIDITDEDVQATLTELTVKTIANEVNIYAKDVEAIYVCGGGAYNVYLLERLRNYLPKVKVLPTTELGIPVQLVEAVAFSWLAYRRINEKAGNLHSVTGAEKDVLLGVVCKSKN
ncbi:anhydro-N-acetylmuramic acid kinase [Marinifilum sp. D737]|uniref:anhydro-N-acetylmuramic acid kinase n=1 Tax=Marinifilum sp. D737 TaxID=2969628 RepID=UPI0022729347|nr:anhydro-N-acetylmuramic acid kinase [Marinifilum sp. D737]MCY1634586.1 anhydro-N-acetylmuramic acid kinase [Marinifilum sp. D737]